MENNKEFFGMFHEGIFTCCVFRNVKIFSWITSKFFIGNFYEKILTFQMMQKVKIPSWKVPSYEHKSREGFFTCCVFRDVRNFPWIASNFLLVISMRKF